MSKSASCSSGQEHRLGRSRSVEDVWRHDDANSAANDSSCICQKHHGEDQLSSGACRSSYCGVSSARCYDSDSDAESAEDWAEEQHLSYYEWVALPRPVVRPPGLPRPPRRIESAPCFHKWGATAAAAFQQPRQQPAAAGGCANSWADDDEDEDELDLGSLADWMKEGLAEQVAGSAEATTGADRCCQPASSVERAEVEPEAVSHLEPSAAAPPSPTAGVSQDAAVLAAAPPLQVVQAAPDLATGFSCPGVARLVLSQAPAAGGSKAGARRAVAEDEDEEDDDAGDDACSEPTSPGSSDCGCGLDGGSNLGLGSDSSGSRCCSSLSLSSWDTAPLTRHGSLTEEEAVADCEACGVLCAGGCYTSHSFGPAVALEEAGLVRPCSPAPSGLSAAVYASSSSCVAFSVVLAATGNVMVDVVQLEAACGQAGAIGALTCCICTYGCGVCSAAPTDAVPAAELQARALSSNGCGSSACASAVVSPTPVTCWETSAWEQRIAVQQQQQQQHLLAAAAACAADVVECPVWLEPVLGLMLSQVVAEALWDEDL
ncbi:hypothetical protein HXX76_014547 [Chlamydomonas incerta]|uniref:Uncharacterized protein n=1 Tax=Chlamydomonas incerta TaxID=51695 RepID=A0A835SIZ1_CHLIN|nr:hypothetical protein HXX76_014547 [Chlamydomonas incerta]|eukprot:KAG2424338.1 hypothetical protein HXX76_014547 [Chlamydomonas incerta]